MHRNAALQRRLHGAAFILLALWRQVERLPVKPLVTLAALAALVAVHALEPPASAWGLRRVCISAAGALRASAPAALSLAAASALTHGSDAHLWGNAASFLHKGAQLEARWGGARLAGALAALTLLTQALYVPVALALGRRDECAVGFSGVIFALKVILQWQPDAPRDAAEVVAGLRVPLRAAAWAELVAIQLVSPHASFVAHLAGILAGLLWVGGERLAARAAAPAVPPRRAPPPPAPWACATCTLANDRAARACAACGAQRGGAGGGGDAWAARGGGGGGGGGGGILARALRGDAAILGALGAVGAGAALVAAALFS